MADKKNEQDGVWRTIGGRRVFIKNGQSLADAMKESGKFSRVAKNQDLYKKLDEEDDNGARKYYEKLSEKEISKDLEERKNRLENDYYDEKDKEMYQKFYDEGKKYYDEKYGKEDKKEEKKSSNDRFLEKAKALDDRDKGKISEEEYFKRLNDIDGIDNEKAKEQVKANLDRLGVERPDFLKEKEYEEYKKTRLDDPSKYNDEDFARAKELDEKYLDRFAKEDTKVVRYRDEYAVIQNGGIQKTFKNVEDAKKYENELRNKSSNETMNNAIREKASKKSKFKDDLPKATEIKTQGTSNRKEVSENIQAHILDYYDSPEDFMSQMEYMHEPTMWHAGQRIAEGGSYLIYNDDMAELLDSLKINPKGKKFDSDKSFQMYTSLVGRESERLYNRLKKNAYNKYKAEHPLTKMTFEEFKEQSKKY